MTVTEIEKTKRATMKTVGRNQKTVKTRVLKVMNLKTRWIKRKNLFRI